MLDKLLLQKVEKVINEKILTIEQINSGYSRTVLMINKKYVLKIATSLKKDSNTTKEVKFLLNSNLDFTPKVIFNDCTKKEFPYVYYLEEKINGESLLLKWPLLKESEKEYILNQLLNNLEKLHLIDYASVLEDNPLTSLLKEYNDYLNKIIIANILPNEKIQYLQELKKIIPNLFDQAKTGFIHGDLHFNNILVNDKKEIVLIDFENIRESFVEKEFDPINRMARNPNSFNTNSKIVINSFDFRYIMSFIKNNISEIKVDDFDDRLLFFDCLNSLMWLEKYPKYELYNDILFNKSRKLLKKYDIIK